MSKIKIQKSSGGLGADVHGVDLSKPLEAHLLSAIKAAWADARARMTDVGRLGDLIDRAATTMLHIDLERVSPLAVPVLILIGREQVAQQAAEDPRKSLLRDLEDAQQLGDRDAGIAADEVDRAVVGAPEAVAGQDRVRLGREVPVRVEQHLHRLTQLIFAQEHGIGAGSKRDHDIAYRCRGIDPVGRGGC